MYFLTEQEKEKIIEMIKNGQPIPSMYKKKLFSNADTEFIETTKDYKLVYKGKERKEDIIANTPAAPLQKIRSFSSDNSFDDDWTNMLIYGDNLMALKAIYDDQRKENRLKTRNKIKLIYIDPPFATKQDFMKDKEKAYRDKIIGAKFIEFLRKRLILLREILADDGSIYVHLDWKKGHYIKAIMDEIFGEHNFVNEVIWKRYHGAKNNAGQKWWQQTDSLFWYSKSDDYIFKGEYKGLTPDYIEKEYKYVDEKGRRYRKARRSENSKYQVEQNRYYLENAKGSAISNLWDDISHIASNSYEYTKYPTQKPENLLRRIIENSSNEGDIILDCFLGSGTTCVVAEKLNRRWIGIDSSKLSIYTTQKRLLNLINRIGTANKDERREHERVNDFIDHSKSNSRGLFMVYEKARKGELIINDRLLNDLANFLEKHMRTKSQQTFSLCCPNDKFDVKELVIKENNDEYKAGEKIIQIGKITFLISFIQGKDRPEKEKHLKAKEFTLYNAGVYDFEKIKELDWEHYRDFVIQLFNVREEKERIFGFEIDGYINTYPVYIWNYPEKKEQRIDIEYIKSIHESLEGKAGDKLYIIAPIVSLEFMQDEVKIGNTTYTILKVPESILLKLMEKGKDGALEQPITENDVNEVIDAVGYDFISQPVVEFECFKGTPPSVNLFNKDNKDYFIKINKFKSNTLASDPDDFDNFETLSMIMIDTDFNGDYFELNKLFWAEDLVNVELERTGKDKGSYYKEKIGACEFLTLRIKEEEFKGNKMMVIFIDKYGNEKKVVLNRSDFNDC